ncbi:TPA: type II toxin-antitoxin system VapC family toxin [Candidatus Woesearchaeota archaeon]|nr:PIN domain-containing protein [Candidatus Woesearchaeota archaeon]HIH39616.1 type II toxin-antitoxin system VapC family toxin [Candidatus Woesearchaeota archaeon]
MTDEIYFFDSYAIIEIIRGSDSYKRYVSSNIVTAKLNLFELYYWVCKELNDINTAKDELMKYSSCILDYDLDIIEKAAELKLKKRNLSMTDCIGYMLAVKLDIKFLTGDHEFQNMPNVEFVK